MAHLAHRPASFSVLYRHFIVATSKLRPVVLKEYYESSELPWAEASNSIYEKSIRASEPINHVFKSFCDDGEVFLAKLS
jgi:hypothetical protein